MPCLRAQPCVFLDPSFGCLQMSSVIPMSSLHIESTSQTKKPSDAYCRKLCSASAFASSAASCRIICIASAFASSLAMCLILNCSHKDPYDNRYQCTRCVDDPARQTQPTSAFTHPPEMTPAGGRSCTETRCGMLVFAGVSLLLLLVLTSFCMLPCRVGWGAPCVLVLPLTQR